MGTYTDNEFGDEPTISELKSELELEIRSESEIWKPVLLGIVQLQENVENVSPRRLMILGILADWKMEIEAQRYQEMFQKNGT